jgi:hypothetical protein
MSCMFGPPGPVLPWQQAGTHRDLAAAVTKVAALEAGAARAATESTVRVHFHT